MSQTSPYALLDKSQWAAVTQNLVSSHPLGSQDIISVVKEAWAAILASKIGDAQIGVDIFPQPQVMGNYLHELIPLYLKKRFPNSWKRGNGNEKDAVYIPDDKFSFEIKTSSNPTKIFGNRSYAQPGAANKAKSGYYLAVNFEKFTQESTVCPDICKIRFGWIDSTDWVGQQAATGQQAHLPPDVYSSKFIELF